MTNRTGIAKRPPRPPSVPVGMPTVTISVDLDQRWGVRSRIAPIDHPLDAAFLHMPELVHRILVAMERRRISGTWFVPAALTCGSWDEYFAVSPDDPRGLPDRYRITTAHRDLDPTGRLHFLPAVIEELVAGGVHEIASLGFSMLPLDLPGVTEADIIGEVRASVQQFAGATGRQVTSAAFAAGGLACPEAILRATSIERFRAGRQPVLGPDTPAKGVMLRPRSLGINRLIGEFFGSDRSQPPSVISTVGFDLASDVAPWRWEMAMRGLTQSVARIPVGNNLHLRWATRPSQSELLDIDAAAARFVEFLEAIGRGAEQSGAIVATMEQLAESERAQAA